MTLRLKFRSFAEGRTSGGFSCLLRALLAPVGAGYAAIMRLRALLYRVGVLRVYRAPVPVISVGNLSVGGTGKTPVVDWLTRELIERGERPAIISRGYGGAVRRGVAIVSRGGGEPPLQTAQFCGDEPYLLARRNPYAAVVVAPRRREGIVCAVSELGSTVVILDDGFQHLAVARDLDCVLLDAHAPFGNGHVLPAGLLRESRAALRRADLLLLTRYEGEDLPHLPVSRPFVLCRHRLATSLVDLLGQGFPLSQCMGARIVAFAGVAAPDSFFAQLRQLGLNLVATMALEDHVVYDEIILERLRQCGATADFFVTTEKDGVKLRAETLNHPCLQVPLELSFEPQQLLEEALDRLLRKS